jgi:hypothetical protein
MARDKKTNSITFDGYDDNCAVIKIQPLKNKSFNVKCILQKQICSRKKLL